MARDVVVTSGGTGKLTDQRREALIAATSTGRAGTPRRRRRHCALLASPAARQITGQVLAVNGEASAPPGSRRSAVSVVLATQGSYRPTIRGLLMAS